MSTADDLVVRVLIVDDMLAIRTFLRMLLSTEERFEIVGEAANGQEAVALADLLNPDLVVLDLQMPVMTGLEAIPHIRERSPGTAIVLYTAGAQDDTKQVAIAAGAVGVIDKSNGRIDVAEQLAHLLVQKWDEPAAEIEMRVGPVSSGAVRAWVVSTRQIVDAVAAHPEVLEGPPLPPEMIAQFHGYLNVWEQLAGAGDPFFWAARGDPGDVERLVSEWARIDGMSDDQLAALGCQWSPPEARPFFQSLTEAVITALERHHVTRELARALKRSWPAAGGAGQSVSRA